MASFYNTFRSWFGRGGAIGEQKGVQNTEPSTSLIVGTSVAGVDGALQIAAVWACCELRANTIGSLPCFVYKTRADGEKTLARGDRLYEILHDSPNSRMTSFEFFRALILNLDLTGNAYARIDRDNKGEAVALWPMPSSQVEMQVLDDGSSVYLYSFGNDVVALAAENVLHIKGLGNGTTGLDKLSFMRSTTDEATKAQSHAAKIFGSSGKPTGTLSIDKVLNPEQRKALMANFAGMAEGNASRLYLLEASMKYAQLSINPVDLQLLETRQFTISEIARWYGVPEVLIGHSGGTTAWGSGIAELKDGFFTIHLRPLLVSIEQAIRKCVMTPRQRATMKVEFNFDAMLRGNMTQRADVYSKLLQNGVMQRSEARQLEGLPYIKGSEGLTVQSNLLPLEKIGTQVASGGTGSVIAQ
jgi:HK97 family phage portal protein